MKKKKLKKQIRKLNMKIGLLEARNRGLQEDINHLCEDYNSHMSAIIRVGYEINKAFERSYFSGVVGKPKLTGLFLKGKITEELLS